MSNKSGDFYNQQPGEFFRGGVYSSQEFHDENIDKTVCPSYKKIIVDTQNTIVNHRDFNDIFDDPQFIPYANELLNRLFKQSN